MHCRWANLLTPGTLDGVQRPASLDLVSLLRSSFTGVSTATDSMMNGTDAADQDFQHMKTKTQEQFFHTQINISKLYYTHKLKEMLLNSLNIISFIF